MTSLLWTIAVLAEIVLFVLAWIGVQKIREDIRRRSMPYDGGISTWPMPNESPEPAREHRVPRIAAPASEPARPVRKPRPVRVVQYLSLRVDNGHVPEVRSRKTFRGELKAV